MPRLTDRGDAEASLERREVELRDWMRENAPYCTTDQRHLETGTPEQAYWRYGYLIAMRDVLALLKKTSTPDR